MTNSKEKQQSTPERQMAAKSRRGFLTLGLGAAAAVGGWEWLWSRPDQDDIPSPFRRVLNFNKNITQRLFFDDRRLAPSFSPSKVGKLKPNGQYGLDPAMNAADWKLRLLTRGNNHKPHILTLSDIQNLPRTEHVTEFKCIEGWSTVVHWAGTRFSDFTSHFAPGSEKAAYVSFDTPDEEYYVGIDMPSALHPQTLLCYEMNGQPLTSEHGAPLRLIIPVKYGIKNLKRIGTITYQDERPDDYWAERGYDYYAAL